jgi:hypothetical protein
MKDDVLEQLRRIRSDLTAAQAKLTDAMRLVAALDIPDPGRVPCPECGLEFSERRLAEHLYVVHGGSTPAAWQDAEKLAKEPAA